MLHTDLMKQTGYQSSYLDYNWINNKTNDIKPRLWLIQ